MLLPRKDRKPYLKLLNDFIQDRNPIGPSELVQVEFIAIHPSQYRRLLRLMADLSGVETINSMLGSVGFSQDSHGGRDDMPSLENLEKLQRCENHILRNFYRAQAELERLQRIRLGEKVPARLTLDINN